MTLEIKAFNNLKKIACTQFRTRHISNELTIQTIRMVNSVIEMTYNLHN